VSVGRASHVLQPCGLGLGEDPGHPGQGQDFSLEAKAKAKTFVKCPRGSSKPRPGLEDNKTENYCPQCVW